ncbi:MAG: 2'-O-glycosyltransferase CruG [Cyanobacteria bacterium P01_H01_bin.15]
MTGLMSEATLGGLSLALLILQVPACLLLLTRLIKGAIRIGPLQPASPEQSHFGSVSVVVPTLNEAERLSPCLAGLSHQTHEVREITIVDSRSQDGTSELVLAAGEQDPRIRLRTDDPLPTGWVGRPWALDYGFRNSAIQAEWFLGIDADTQPQPGLVASLLRTAEAENYDLISLAPRFLLKYPGEWWLQPALLMTLLFRFDVAGSRSSNPKQVMANGQCFFCRRSVLDAVGGYTSAASSFCDDVTLAREIAQAGYRVGFLDGSDVIKVRMYDGAQETWDEWGRSLDLKDAASPGQLRLELWQLFMVQGLPIFLVFFSGLLLALGADSLSLRILFGLNLGLLAVRWAMLLAIRGSYDFDACDRSSLFFWLSPLADPLAVLRVFISASRQPTRWRGREYGPING